MHLSLLALLVAGPLWIYAANKRAVLPPSGAIVAELSQEPIQQRVEQQSYQFDYMDASYSIFPKAKYEIYGMVVTKNNISSIANIYHTSSSVDFKDLCVLWGPNVKGEVYKEAKFWSDPFTCWYQPQTPRARREFSVDHIANNHLLSKFKSVRESVNSVNIGDQVYMSGYLIDYCPLGSPHQMRKTSMVRTDTGPGACEVLMVEDFEILFRNNPFWNQLYFKSKSAFWILLVLVPLFWLGWIYQEQRKQKASLDEAKRSYQRRFVKSPKEPEQY